MPIIRTFDVAIFFMATISQHDADHHVNHDELTLMTQYISTMSAEPCFRWYKAD